MWLVDGARGRLLRHGAVASLMSHALAMVVPLPHAQCLHRFCSECISKALRFGKKECPTCRAKCASMRSLRRDTVMDDIVRLVYPDPAEYDRRQALVRVRACAHACTRTRAPCAVPATMLSSSQVRSTDSRL